MNCESLSIVVVGDEQEMRDQLVASLSYLGFEVRGVCDGNGLDSALAQKPAHIVLLDLGLPGEDGLKIVSRLRDDPTLGVIVLTARSLTEERVLGLQSGADHYFVKPVDLAELAAAMRNLGRRLVPPMAIPWRFSAESSCLKSPNDISISLTARECIFLDLIFTRPGEFVSYQQIYDSLEESGDCTSKARVEVMISRLRSKVQRADPAAQRLLRNRHKLGYAIFVENE